MKKKNFSRAVLILGAACATQSSVAAESISEAFTKGEAHLNLRLRYESVTEDQSSGENTGSALTLKSRLNFKTEAYHGLTAFVEMDDVSNFAGSSNDGVNGEISEPLIADPVGTELNQAFLAYKNWNTEFKYGRQRITLDNLRFVGHVAWRQNEQTYDALSVANSSVDKLKVSYTHISNVNRIFGEDSTVGDMEMDTHLINANYSFAAGSLSGYAYLLESDDNFAGFKRVDTDTYGVRWQGKAGIVAYNLEYATQKSNGDNPADYTADYMLAEANIDIAPLVLGLGYEVLSADDDGFFITPLATLFKFQGWTDNFVNRGLGNISEGVKDAYLTVSGAAYGMNWQLAYHDFSSDQDNVAGGSDLGSELGAVVGKAWGPYSAELRYASYSAGDSSPFNGGGLTLIDTQKVWLTFNVNF
ncbi:alginate export family protein [Zhongshania marina]|uniref:alginate export family protein n=1 Tax=Zhongshania marina TaxID=2304603 RepID=UPI001304FAEA|nr:alginate export family protein [Marortus luteolus]